MENPRQRLERFRKGVDILSKEIPDTTKRMFDFIHKVQKKGKLSVREKELIAIGVSLYHKCEDCIAVHVLNALQAGCTRQEIMEAAEIAMVFGGGFSLAASATLLIEALDEFEKDFIQKSA
ncbi:MAG: carboxymuconolactone decarboxylase family protein [Pseudomonadota bacterium]